MLIVMDDFNAKVSKDNKGIERCFGQHSIKNLSQTGERHTEPREVSYTHIASTISRLTEILKVI